MPMRRIRIWTRHWKNREQEMEVSDASVLEVFKSRWVLIIPRTHEGKLSWPCYYHPRRRKKTHRSGDSLSQCHVSWWNGTNMPRRGTTIYDRSLSSMGVPTTQGQNAHTKTRISKGMAWAEVWDRTKEMWCTFYYTGARWAGCIYWLSVTVLSQVRTSR